MRMSPEVEIALHVAEDDARRRKHEYLTLEHLLFALLFDDATVKVVRHAGGDASVLKKRLDRYLSDQLEPLVGDDTTHPTPSLGVKRAIRRAAQHVESSGKQEVTGANVLIAMYAERDSFAVSLLEEQGITRLDVVSYVSHGVSKIDDDTADAPAGRGAEPDGESARPSKDPLKAYCINLNEEARTSRIDPLVGRENEVARVVQILARRK
jgi:ATP-dependent Clp protease ATP-binding subunit ClpA